MTTTRRRVRDCPEPAETETPTAAAAVYGDSPAWYSCPSCFTAAIEDERFPGSGLLVSRHVNGCPNDRVARKGEEGKGQ